MKKTTLIIKALLNITNVFPSIHLPQISNLHYMKVKPAILNSKNTVNIQLFKSVISDFPFYELR